MVCFKVLLLCSLMTITSAQIFTPGQTDKIKELVTSVMKCVEVPGLTLAVVKGNQTWTHGFGYADLSTNQTVNSSTLFGIGSITKAFTTALLSLNIEGIDKYKWTSKVADILEDFKLTDEIRSKETSLRDILSHRTGLLPGNIGLFSGFPHKFTRQDMTKRLQYLGEFIPFRDAFIYNNWMYALAGYITEVMTGQTWEEQLKTRILEPLEMFDTRVLGHDVTVTDDNIATPYVMIDNEVVISSPEIYSINPGEPAGAIASSADDMSKWIQLILNKGNMTDGTPLIDWQTFQEAFQPHINLPNQLLKKPVFPIADVNIGYGYGWFIANHDGYTKYWHSGGLYGYVAMLWIFPDLDIGFYGNINGPGTSNVSKVFSTIFPYLFDLIMEKEPWLNSSTACSFPLPWVPNPPLINSTDDVTNKPVGNVKQYVGEYGHRLLGNIQITAEDNYLLFNMSFLKGYLNATDKVDTFKVGFTGDLAFLTRPQNTYQLYPFIFHDKNLQQVYQSLFVELEENQKCKFQRGVRWEDTDSTASISSRLLFSMLVTMFVFFVLIICIF